MVSSFYKQNTASSTRNSIVAGLSCVNGVMCSYMSVPIPALFWRLTLIAGWLFLHGCYVLQPRDGQTDELIEEEG
jgi:hypothetical protein